MLVLRYDTATRPKFGEKSNSENGINDERAILSQLDYDNEWASITVREIL